jgi:hypothetical protein
VDDLNLPLLSNALYTITEWAMCDQWLLQSSTCVPLLLNAISQCLSLKKASEDASDKKKEKVRNVLSSSDEVKVFSFQVLTTGSSRVLLGTYPLPSWRVPTQQQQHPR